MKKGFTLIELLGTIVILGLIALIATPPIVNLIKKSDKTISENNLKLIYKAGEDYIDEYQNNYTLTKSKKVCLSIQEIVDNGNLKDSFIKQQEIDTKKFIQYTVEDKMKLSYDLKLYDTSCTNTAPLTVYKAGDIIYFNPETNRKCSSGEAVSTTGTKTGCMKWNVITTSDSDAKKTVDIMLDHNTTATVAWGNAEEMTDASTALNRDTTTWASGLNPRIIDGYEVASIANKSWSGSGEWISFPEVTWLYQNTVSWDKGVPNGYWTASVSASWGYAWYVVFDGGLDDHDSVDMSTTYGVRPVITVQKSAIA